METPLIARFMGLTWGPPVGPRWAPCRPHEPCYLGLHTLLVLCGENPSGSHIDYPSQRVSNVELSHFSVVRLRKNNNKANLRDLIAATGLVILHKLDSIGRKFFSLRDLEIWWMTSRNNRAPLLYYINLCASFKIHRRIQTGVTVQKCSIRVKIGIFCPVWPANLTVDLQKQ